MIVVSSLKEETLLVMLIVHFNNSTSIINLNPISKYWKDPETKKLKKKYIGRNHFPNDEQKRQQEEEGNGAMEEDLLLAHVICNFVLFYNREQARRGETIFIALL